MNFESGMAIARVLSINRVLTEVNLGFNEIPDECGSILTAALINNDSLKSLVLAANELELYTCRRFAHLLVSIHNPRCALERLVLSQNALKDEGVSLLAAGLGQNNTLQSLPIAQVGVTEASCQVIAAALDTNTTLWRLNLADNRIGSAGCDALAEALQAGKNSTLKELNLSGNHLRDADISHLTKTLGDNDVLERINLQSDPDLTTKTFQALEEVLLHNFSLLYLWLPPTMDLARPNSCIPSYIKLNRMGRRQLWNELDRTRLWVDAVQEGTSDIRCLYWLTYEIQSIGRGMVTKSDFVALDKNRSTL
eukprot:scaffold8126_cov170-Amphora_coffeaeformis.AAC.14